MYLERKTWKQSLSLFNEEIYKAFPDVRPLPKNQLHGQWSPSVYVGGLGFVKWNMGWMHDTLTYMNKDTIYRKYHHHELTFSMLYAF